MNSKSTTDEVSFRELFRKIKFAFKYLLSKWMVIIISALVCGSFGFFYAKTKKTNFISDTSFSIDEEKGSGGGSLLGLASTFGFDMAAGGNLFTNENILELFKSKKIIYAALLSKSETGEESHADAFLKENSERTEKVFNAGDSPNSMSRTQDSILTILYRSILKNTLTVNKPDRKVDIYHVVVQCPNEILCVSFSKALVREVSELYTEIKTLKSKQTVDILQHKVDSLKGSFNRAIYGQAAIQDANINPTFKAATVGVTQRQTEIASTTEAYKELLKNLEMSKYSLLKQSPLFHIIDEPRYPLDKIVASGVKYAFLGAFLGCFFSITALVIYRLFQKRHLLFASDFRNEAFSS